MAKQSSNQSGPEWCAKTVDKPTSNVATRPARTTRRERPQIPTRPSNQKGPFKTESQQRTQTCPACQRESSLILRRISRCRADLGPNDLECLLWTLSQGDGRRVYSVPRRKQGQYIPRNPCLSLQARRSDTSDGRLQLALGHKCVPYCN